MDIKAIVTDIEGTTTKISFVHDVLFPYASKEMAGFVKANAGSESLVPILNEVKTVAQQMGHPVSSLDDLDEIVALLQQWIEEDKKITPLKTLQGLIWRTGYAKGDFTGHLYSEVPETLRQWSQQGIGLYIYSSGSEEAQRLLFQYSDFGDLSSLLNGYFDTRIGAKREAQAYERISAEIGVAPNEILFLSDVEEELDAAKSVGFNTCCLIRETHCGITQHTEAARLDEVSLL